MTTTCQKCPTGWLEPAERATLSPPGHRICDRCGSHYCIVRDTLRRIAPPEKYLKAIWYDGLRRCPGLPVFRAPTSEEATTIVVVANWLGAHAAAGGCVGVLRRADRQDSPERIRAWVARARERTS